MARSAACASPRRSPDLRCFASRMKGLLAFHRRCIHPDPRALDQPVLGQKLQHPGEDLVMNFQRQTRAGPRQPGVIRHALPARQQQELAQAQAVRTTPLDPALAVRLRRLLTAALPETDCFAAASNPLEVAHQQHAEVAPGRQRLPTPGHRRIMRLAERLDMAVDHAGSPAAGRRTDGPAIAAAPTSSAKARSAAPSADPGPCLASPPSRRHRFTIKRISSTRC
jgi:hypothetical protein